MSLRIWLPLDGDLKQQGASNIIATASNATVNTSGKIGSCYAFNNSNSYIQLEGNDLYSIIKGGSDPFSICFWVFHADTTRAIIFGDYGLTGAINFNIELGTNHSVRFYWNGSPDKTFNSTSYVAASGWTHIAITYNGSAINIYKDGILSSDTWTGTLATKNKTSGVYYLGRDSRTGSTTLNGRLNDFRIYDHCLSATEVKEIAQGLVLHYKLDGGAIGNPNLLPNSKLDGSWTYPSSSYSDKYSAATTIIPTGTQYVLSFDAKSTVNGDKMRTHYYNPNTTTTCVSSQGITKTASDGNMDFTLSTNWERYWVIYTQTDTTAAKRVICPRLVSGQGTGTVSVKNVKLEEGTVSTAWRPAEENGILIEDSSGYNHNGAIIGDLVLGEKQGRYSNSLRWNSSAPTVNSEEGICYIQSPFTLTTPLQMSITWWAKPESGYGGSTNHAAFCTSNNASRPSDYNTTAFHHRDAGFDIYPSDASGVKRLSFTYTANAWHHYAITYDGTTAKAYQDGILKTNVTVGTNKTLATFSQLYIGYSQAGGVKRKTLGNYSDFRIYITALSQEDILQLYHTSAKVDNKQNLHAFELVENNSKIQINKYGQILCNELEEDAATKFYKTDQIIETNEIIEL